ncbi:tetratricopeptide repeat protein [Kitasatospora sp. NPDC005856]|uniref:tetratricopeptide repeat protein n=1 Tax=Kitasatospora sp. NPDC005856 TaxID=3154566 RepID=UPI0033FA650B
MERGRLAGVNGPGGSGSGSGYAVGGRLVLTSAHVTGPTGSEVQVFHPGGSGTAPGRVVWRGTPGGRDDAALVLVDPDPSWQPPTGAVRWGRTVTDRPGTECETWGLPDVAQRDGRAAEAEQLLGTLNPGSGFVGNQYVVNLRQHRPERPAAGASAGTSAGASAGTSAWGGLSGAAVFAGRVVIGVVSADRAHYAGGQLNAVPAYVLHHDPAFRAALADHGAGAHNGLEAVEFQHLADRVLGHAAQGAAPTVAALLQARRQVVPFHGRQELLDELRAWCARGGFGAWLLHGPGGQGKTRLAHHLAVRLAADGWAVLWPKESATAEQVAELRHTAKPLLVVLDYAETRTGQIQALVEAAAEHPGSTPFKVLLLARTGGDWWRQVLTADATVEEHLANAPSRMLAPLQDDPGQRADWYRDAARALAAALPLVDGMAGRDWPAAAALLPTPPRLDQDAYGNALTLHMTALADLLDTEPGGAEPASGEAETVEDRLLTHERRYWRNGAAALGLVPTLSTATLETALAAAHLTGAADREDADRLWRRLPALADQPRDRRNRVTAWLAALYPATSPGGPPWGTLQPDRLAERHIGHVLSDDPALADQLLDGAHESQAAQLLTVYSRAAAHPVFQQLDTRLTDLCVRRHEELAAHIVTIATRTDHPAPLTTALDAVITDPTATFDGLIALYKLFPRASHRLVSAAAQLALNVTNHCRVLAQINPGAYLPNLASCLDNLAVRLGNAGRHEEGLAAVQEAVELRRSLAEVNRDVHMPNLAGSLSILASRLGDVGRREEGLAAVQEAVELRRSLAQAGPDVHMPDLALTLNNLANRLGDVGRCEEGLAAIQESVEIRRALAQVNSDAYLPNLALTLNNLAVRLGDVGRREEGLAAIQESVEIRRALAQANPDAYLPNLASSLNNLAVQLGRLGRREEGLAAIQEAVELRRALTDANPEAHLPNLGASLHNLANRLSDVGRREEGLAAIQEAVDIRRALAEASPDAHVPNLAGSLNNLAVRLGRLGRREEGLAAAREAVSYIRDRAQASPSLFESLLQLSLETEAWLEGMKP